MINSIIVIEKDLLILKESKKLFDEPLVISFEINSVEELENISISDIHHSSLLKRPHVYYTFYFNIPNVEKEFFLQQFNSKKNLLVQFFFHPQYKKIGDKPLLFFSENLEDIFGEVSRYFMMQGYEGVESIVLMKKCAEFTSNCSVSFPSDMSINKIAETYYELLSTDYYSCNYIGIKSSNYENVFLSFVETEKKLHLENPKLFFFLVEFNRIKKELVGLERNLKLTNHDLENQKTYLEFFKNNDEALKINEFYRNEYEILPLWYKKFGHIIKVIMGKRSFRSLFDNDVNKYKN